MLVVVIVMVIIVVLALLAWTLVGYNGLVRARNGFRNAFAQVDVRLQRRYDLVPNLVGTAQGYLAHEKSALEEVTRARAAALSGMQAAQVREAPRVQF